MSFNEMKKALSLLNDGLKILDMFEDPESSFVSTSSEWPTTGLLRDAIPLVEDFQRNIRNLSQHLNNTIQQYSTLVMFLIQRGGSAIRRQPAIHRLPKEIVIEIIHFLVEDGSHNLRPLLLVDKRFHALVISVPSLWCNINLKFGATFQEFKNLSIPYIETCIEHSQQSPLNISLNMTDITTPWGCATSLFAVIRDAMPQFTDLVDMAMDVIADGDWFDDGPFYDGRLEEVKNMVRAVVGPVGLHMARWRSFEFSPPADYEWAFPGEAIWELFTHPTPNLEVFVLNGPISSEITPFSDVFPDLKSVRHLTLCDPDPDGFREASLSRHLLRTAVLHYDSENTLEVLSSCNALQELTITNIRRDSTDPVGRQDVELHSLRRLTLEGDMSALEHVVFHAPSLEDVTLRCEQVQGLPKVRARSCVWVPGGEKISDLMTSSVRGLLVGVEELEELIIECEPVEGLGVAVREMIEQQGSSVMETLRVIRFVKSGMEVDIIHIK